jgi:hypothetical protein
MNWFQAFAFKWVNFYPYVAAKPDYVPILRKILKIITNVMLNSPSLVIQRLIDTRSARGSMVGAVHVGSQLLHSLKAPGFNP